MAEIDKIVKEFLSSLPPFIHSNIISVVVYGSRILKSHRPDSDLDILIIIDGNNNYRIGKIIASVRCDATIYSFNDIYDIIEAKKNTSNQYFHSVLDHGYIYEDKMYLIPTLKDYLATTTTHRKRRKINNLDLFELKNLYEEFQTTPTDFNYYNLLEKIRTIYHSENRYSYLSLAKVIKTYEESAYYTKNYHLHLPPSNFRDLFLKAVYSEKLERPSLIASLLKFLNIPAFLPEPPENKIRYYDEEEIKYYLLVIFNRLNELSRLCNTPQFPYILNVTEKQLFDFCQDIGIMDETIGDVFASLKNAPNNFGELKILYQILTHINANYHFDYDNYMVKLKR